MAAPAPPHPRRASLALEHLSKESKRCALVLPFLHQNIHELVILADGPPKVQPLAIHGHDLHFVEEPVVARRALPLANPPRVLGTLLGAPAADGFMRHLNTSLSQQFFDVT